MNKQTTTGNEGSACNADKPHSTFALCNYETSNLSIAIPFAGLILHAAGIILILMYTNIGRMIVLFMLSVLLISIKYWENFITMGKQNSTFDRRLKRELHIRRTKTSCKVKSSDILFSDWCIKDSGRLAEKCTELLAAFILLFMSILLITRHVWKSNGRKNGETARIFVSPFYYGIFTELFLLLSRRRDDDEYDIVHREKYLQKSGKEHKKRRMFYACCATMWHENATEMRQLVTSILRDFYEKQINLPAGSMLRTPYGSRIEWTLPGDNKLFVHLKDKTKVRNKKPWSQLDRKKEIQETAENTFLLAFDGDVDFQPEAVLSLLRRMEKNDKVGAACDRIHPIGNGPMVWYQQFEYAISHWLQKATEHVIGCVLCSPGCFSLFRGSAILYHDVLETYTSVAQEARQCLQYDQGEDRWLCTLLLQKGWKIEYCAESDSHTFAPESFNEFYTQRRRWTPSTMANILEIIQDWKNVTKNNENISFLYIVYQVILFVSTILTPGTIFMIIMGALIVGFDSIPTWLALILNLIPVIVFILMCLYTSIERQVCMLAVF
ncbi:CHS1 [Mytilus coruscus]|uniref:chitin synthase n=1 Tax=Mytilus coruscus TaxID=42192 RepID=A0A6J8BEF1_MYTCO|nr:CHS1 [Mytilus coruscus]